jgi:Resolvase, N terminal domain
LTVDRARPAAYIRSAFGDDADLARHHEAVAEGARQRGWPPPVVYAEDPSLAEGYGPALARLEAAIEAGRHDALLITDPGAATGTATHLMRLLFRCTRHGVVVGFLLPPAPGGSDPMGPQPTGSWAGSRPAAEDELPFPVRREAWGVLARARIEALSELFPGWRIWLDQAGWHARRRDAIYLQARTTGAPAFSVHADNPTDLAAQLCWQQAADRHAPNGCPPVRPAGRDPARP